MKCKNLIELTDTLRLNQVTHFTVLIEIRYLKSDENV